MKKLILLTLLLSQGSFAQSTNLYEKGTEADLLDFSSIKDLIKKDGLEVELEKKETKRTQTKAAKAADDHAKFNVPKEADFWNMFSELWLVKNATRLKWDFQKPEFDIEKSFVELLETQGHYEKKIKILLLDSTEVIHAALPTNDKEYIFLISLPFIRTLDLSKVEISLILFEDYLRARRGYFKEYVSSKDLEKYLGTNFKGSAFNKKLIDDHLKKYSTLLFEKGFSFQQQFEVTKEMDTLLKSDLKIWNTYLKLLEKMDQITKTNELYKKYPQIYPSPELQMNWLKPTPTRF